MILIKKILPLIFTFLLLKSNQVFTQTVDTILISATSKEIYAGPYCMHRVGNDFKEYSPDSKDWSKITSTSYWLYPNNIHWIYFVIENKDAVDRTLKLYLNNVQAGITEMYFLQNGVIDTAGKTGSLLPSNMRSTKDRSLAIPFVITSGKTLPVYIKTSRKEIGITLTPVLYETYAGDAPVWPDNLLLIVLGFLFIICIASVIVLRYFFSKENLYFFLYIFFGFLYILAASGYGSLYVWSGFPAFEENAPVFLGSLSTAAFLEFSRRILEIKNTHPFFNKLILACSIIYPVIGFIGFAFYATNFNTGEYSSLLQIPYLLMFVCFAFILWLSVYKAIKKKQKEFWWFVSIFTSYFLMAIVMTMLEVGYLKYNHYLHAVLLSFGALPQMTLTLVFLIKRVFNLLKQRTTEITNVRLQGQQDLLKERLRVSKDLHDEVGSTLSGIAMYTHLTKQQIKNASALEVENSLNIMQYSAGEMVNKLNDIVWLINPEHDTLTKLVQRLEDYTKDMAAIKNMQVKINTVIHLHEYNLTIEKRRNIYLICKEAINNAVKYSGATILEFSIEEKNNMLKFYINDNGKGFDVPTIRRGNGLNNMQKRAEEIGALFTVTSKANEKTLISLQLKIT